MDSYASMRQKLAPLRLYSLEEGSAVDCELKAYAEGLNPLNESLAHDTREAFIATAEDEGLRERERFLDREKPDLPVETRRALLLGLERVGTAEATPDGFLQYLHDCGLEQVTVREVPTRQFINVFIDDRLDEGGKTRIAQKIAQAAPAHLPVRINYQDGTSVIV